MTFLLFISVSASQNQIKTKKYIPKIPKNNKNALIALRYAIELFFVVESPPAVVEPNFRTGSNFSDKLID